MRHVLALFDAPVPAASAVRRLIDDGYSARDIFVAAEAPVPSVGRWARGQLPHEAEALEQTLRGWGMTTAEAGICAEGVARRGAILVAVRCPTASSTAAAGILSAAAPPDPAEHRARWAAEPGARYMWAHVPPPATG